MRAHLRFTAFLFAVCGVGFLAVALVAVPLANTISLSVAHSADEHAQVAAALIEWTGRWMAIGSAVLAGPTLLCAWGLLRHAAWSRWLGIFLGALAVVMIPIGTMVGGYVLWVLLSERFEPWFDDPMHASSAMKASGRQVSPRGGADASDMSDHRRPSD